jgi:hypothetical protein
MHASVRVWWWWGEGEGRWGGASPPLVLVGPLVRDRLVLVVVPWLMALLQGVTAAWVAEGRRRAVLPVWPRRPQAVAACHRLGKVAGVPPLQGRAGRVAGPRCRTIGEGRVLGPRGSPRTGLRLLYLLARPPDQAGPRALLPLLRGVMCGACCALSAHGTICGGGGPYGPPGPCAGASPVQALAAGTAGEGVERLQAPYLGPDMCRCCCGLQVWWAQHVLMLLLLRRRRLAAALLLLLRACAS